MANTTGAIEILEWDGLSAFPDVAPVDKARIVLNITTLGLFLSLSTGAYQPLLFGGSSGGMGIIAWGASSIPVGAGAYRLPTGFTSAAPTTTALGFDAPQGGTIRNLTVVQNGVGVGAGPITYEVYVNGAASGVLVAISAAAASGSDFVNSIEVDQGDTIELRATHAGITTAPTRVLVAVEFGVKTFGQDYQSALSAGLSTTTLGTFQTKLTMVTPALTGTYRIGWTAVVSGSVGSTEIRSRLQNTTDAVTIGSELENDPTGSAELVSVGGFAEVVFAGVAKTFEIQFFKAGGGGSAEIQNARIELWRVS